MIIKYIFQYTDTPNPLFDGLFILLGTLVGGLITFVSQKYFEYKKENKEKKEIIDTKKVILTELKELEVKMMFLVHKIKSMYGRVDRKLLEWEKEIISKYDGANLNKEHVDLLDKVLKFDDSQLKDLDLYFKEKNIKKGIELKKISLFLFHVDFSILRNFDPLLRSEILDLKTRVDYLNQIVDDARYYFRLTFRNKISEGNYEKANENMISSYENYSTQAEIIVNLIQKISLKLLN